METPIIELEWDYKYPENTAGVYSQSAWNQTLITRMNQCYANVRKQEVYLNAIEIHPLVLKDIIEHLEYYDKDTNSIGNGRWHVEQSVSQDIDKITLYCTNMDDPYAIIKLLNFPPQ
jgi:hypothetical protein